MILSVLVIYIRLKLAECVTIQLYGLYRDLWPDSLRLPYERGSNASR